MAARPPEPMREAFPAYALASRPLRGSGYCSGHHGELIQGAVRVDGRATPCLVSLPRADMRATCRLDLFDGRALEVFPRWKRKALRAARLALTQLGLPEASGRLRFEGEIAAGLGLGASTADVVAAIRASASAVGTWLRPEEIAAMAIEAETACDPAMFAQPALLFAQRQGRVLEHWGDWFPDYLVFACFLRPGSEGVDTLSLSTRYSDGELDRFERLIEAARQAFRRRDAAALAEAATTSAILNQPRLRLPWFDTLCDLAEAAGALGVQVSHSGIVGGVLLDPLDPWLDGKVAMLKQAWRRIDGERFTLFRTGPGLAAARGAASSRCN